MQIAGVHRLGLVGLRWHLAIDAGRYSRARGTDAHSGGAAPTTFSGGMLHTLTRIHAGCLPEFHEMSGARQPVYYSFHFSRSLALSVYRRHLLYDQPRSLAILHGPSYSSVLCRSAHHRPRRCCDSSLSPHRARYPSSFRNRRSRHSISPGRHLVAFMAARIANRVITLPFPLFLE